MKGDFFWLFSCTSNKIKNVFVYNWGLQLQKTPVVEYVSYLGKPEFPLLGAENSGQPHTCQRVDEYAG